jgi:hypothetical protein
MTPGLVREGAILPEMSQSIKGELHRKLRVGRANMLANLDGLGEYDVRRPLTATGTNLLGLVKHLAGLEYSCLGGCLGRPPDEKLSWAEDGSIGEGADMWATIEESSDYIIGLYRRAGDQQPIGRSWNFNSTAQAMCRGGRRKGPLSECC